MMSKRVGEQLAGAQPLSNIIENGAEQPRFLSPNQQVESSQDGQSGVNQRDELLIKNYELLHVELAANSQPPFANSQEPARTDRINEETLLDVAVGPRPRSACCPL